MKITEHIVDILQMVPTDKAIEVLVWKQVLIQFSKTKVRKIVGVPQIDVGND